MFLKYASHYYYVNVVFLRNMIKHNAMELLFDTNTNFHNLISKIVNIYVQNNFYLYPVFDNPDATVSF